MRPPLDPGRKTSLERGGGWSGEAPTPEAHAQRYANVEPFFEALYHDGVAGVHPQFFFE